MPRPCSRRLARRRRAARRSLGARRLPCSSRTLRRRATARARVCLSGERSLRGRAVTLALQSSANGVRSRARYFASWTPALGEIALGLAACARRSSLFGRELHSGAARLRQADGNGLLRRPRAVLALANVVHLFAHELAGLRRRRLSLARILVRALDRFSFRHPSPPDQCRESRGRAVPFATGRRAPLRSGHCGITRTTATE